MKKWKVAIPVLVIAIVVSWYLFRPERLFVNQHIEEHFPLPQRKQRRRSLLEHFTVSYTRQKVAQTFTSLGTAAVFFASPTSRRRMVPMCMSIWLLPMMRSTAPVCCAWALSILGR